MSQGTRRFGVWAAALWLWCAPAVGQMVAGVAAAGGPAWGVFRPDFSSCDADAADFGAAGDGVRDDTGAIQAALDVGGHVCIRRPGVYVVSGVLARGGASDNTRLNAALVIRSGTRLTMAPGVRLRLASGSSCYLLRNAAPEAGDRDIAVEGGQLDGNSLGQQENVWERPYWFGHMVLFHRVSGVSVRDMQSINPSRYAFLFAGCTDVAAERIAFRHQRLNSDGVHFQGPSARILVRDLAGTTNDNMAAFVCGEGLYYAGHADEEFGYGDITDVRVERLHSVWGKEPVRLTGRPGTACRRFEIKGITGEVVGGMGVHLTDDPSGNLYGCEMTDITVEGVSCTVPPGYALVAIDASGARGITIRDVRVTNPANSALLVESRPGQTVDLAQVTLAGLRTSSNASRAVRFIGPGVRVRSFTGSDWVLNQQGTGIGLDVGGEVEVGDLSNITVRGGTLLAKSRGTGAGVWRVRGYAMTDVSNGFVTGGTTRLELTDGVFAWSGSGQAPLMLYQPDEAGETRVVGSGLAYAGVMPPGPVYVQRGLFTVDHPQWRMHGAGVVGAPTAGDRFYNLQTTGEPWEGLGVGPVEFDGAAWRRR